VIYLSLAFLLPAFWFGAWWMAIPIAFVLGFWLQGKDAAKFALGCGAAWAALAFVRDGDSAGAVSYRMTGMFSLPSSGIFLVILLLGFVTGFLWFKAGGSLRVLSKK
jgi:hypothetical protein